MWLPKYVVFNWLHMAVASNYLRVIMEKEDSVNHYCMDNWEKVYKAEKKNTLSHFTMSIRLVFITCIIL